MAERETPAKRRRTTPQGSGAEAEPSAATRARGAKPTGRTPGGEKSGKSSSVVPVGKSSSSGSGESNGASMVGAAAQDIGSFIKSQRESAEVSIRQLAERAGVSNPYLSQIERGLRKPSAEVLAQIAKGLRLSAEVLYVRAGILEVRETSAVRDAVLTAPELSERQRDVLLEVYESFVARNSANVDEVVDVD